MKISISYPPLESDKGTPCLGQNRQFQWFNSPTYIYPMVPAYAASLLKEKGYDVIWDDAIAEKLNYEEWKKNTGVKIIAVSIDDIRSKNKVAPYVRGRDWDFEVYLDSNEDLKRAMNINTVPHTFLINGSGEIVWQHNSFAEGDEEKLYERILAISKK